MRAVHILFAGLMALRGTASAEPGPNVLMLPAADDPKTYNFILQNTPGIRACNCDRMARWPINFTRASCAARIRAPLRGALMTGMAPHQAGFYHFGDLRLKAAPARAAEALEEQFKYHQ